MCQSGCPSPHVTSWRGSNFQLQLARDPLRRLRHQLHQTPAPPRAALRVRAVEFSFSNTIASFPKAGLQIVLRRVVLDQRANVAGQRMRVHNALIGRHPLVLPLGQIGPHEAFAGEQRTARQNAPAW